MLQMEHVEAPRTNGSYLEELDDRWNKEILTWAIPQNVVSKFQRPPFHLDPGTFAPRDQKVTDRRLEIIKDRVLAKKAADKKDKTPLTLIDVGAGAGSSLAPIREPFSKITCIEGAPHMAKALRDNLALMYSDSSRYEVVEGIFPDIASTVRPASVVNCSNVVYNVVRLIPFLEALNDLARDLVLLEATLRHPFYRSNPAFKYFWDLDRPNQPTAADIFEATCALGFDPKFESLPLDYRRSTMSIEAMATRLGLGEDRFEELEQFMATSPTPENPSVIIWWEPPGNTMGD
jgi:hypothetical protein